MPESPPRPETSRRAPTSSSRADDAAVENVMMGTEGALAAARPGAVVLEMSTVSPGTPRKLHAEARRTRVQFLDAPVSGSTPQAEQGQLVIFVGGEEAVYNECRPILVGPARRRFTWGLPARCDDETLRERHARSGGAALGSPSRSG